MDIPEQLVQKMQGSGLYGGILQSIAEFKPWFDHSKTPFFPEYTDHNWSHVTQTMATASSLIRDDAWSVITPADAGVLVLAVILHDCGMHLSEDGFLALIHDNLGERQVQGWTEETWPSLWTDFLGDASRFDARKLLAVFGDTRPVHPPHPDPKEWTLRDRLLIGEFLRRHHARLAHEVAVHGVPSIGNPPLQLKGIPGDLADIAGLIARSHGLPLRSSIPALSRYDLREYKGVHAVFLMCALRIADYLQVQAERAPTQILRVRNLRSPLSQREWKAHEAIRDIRNTHEDPEAIYIDASPSTVAAFLGLKRLLTGMQDELDVSWAVLGEVYGRYVALQTLGLTLRRVRSNLDDPSFASTVPYIPCKAALDSAGSELLKLLIAPLYGEHPEIGIRELLQNAVDACRELEDYLNQQSESVSPELTDIDGDVVISLQDRGDEGRWVEVIDRGIGMTAEVIRRYFLRAGASFRRSDAWGRLHETSEGKSRVLRSGRFGIGVLAAFLLGDEVEVSTRHITAAADGGLTFKATIDAEEIELRRFSRPVGTTVKVRISDETAWKALVAMHPGWIIDPVSGNYINQKGAKSWDWYCLAQPKVVRIIGSKKLDQKFSLVKANAELNPDWRRISHPDYEDIQWSYQGGPFLACNGIVVMEEDKLHRRRTLGKTGGFPVAWPNVSVFDPDGNLPLVLQRNGLATSQYPFNQWLFEDVIRDWLAFLLVNAPGRPFDGEILPTEYGRSYPGFPRDLYSTWQDTSSTLFCSAIDGIYPADSWHIRQGNFHRFLLTTKLIPPEAATASLHSQTGCDLIVPVPSPTGVQKYRQWNRFALCGSPDSSFGYLKEFDVTCRRMLLSRAEYKEISRGTIIAKYLWENVSEECSNDKWVVVRTGSCDCGDQCDLLALSDIVPEGTYGAPVMIEWHLASSQPPQEKLTPLARLWKDILPSPVIPYDPAERRQSFSEAFTKLKDYIAAHEQSLMGEREKKQDSSA